MTAVYSRRATAIGRQLAAATEFLAAILEGLNDEEWGRPVPYDGRTVGVLTHHLVDSHPMVIEVARSVSAGGTLPWTREWINEWNAQLAKSNAHCRKAETIRDLRKSVATSTASVKQFTDDQLDVTTQHPLLGSEPAPVAELLHETLVRHTLLHTGAIQRALIEKPTRVVQTTTRRGR